jgi:hypothetical protein
MRSLLMVLVIYLNKICIWTIGGKILTGKAEVPREKKTAFPLEFGPPEISHGLSGDEIQASLVRGLATSHLSHGTDQQ